MVLAASLLVVLFICYQFAFSKTFALYDTYEGLKGENLMFENIPKRQYQLQRQNNYLDSLLQKYQIGGTSLQNNLLKSLNANGDSLGFKLVVFNQVHVFEKEQLTVNSHIFTLEGSFEELLHLVYNLEQRTTFGEIVQARFEKKRDLRTRKDRLEAAIIVQNFK